MKPCTILKILILRSIYTTTLRGFSSSLPVTSYLESNLIIKIMWKSSVTLFFSQTWCQSLKKKNVFEMPQNYIYETAEKLCTIFDKKNKFKVGYICCSHQLQQQLWWCSMLLINTLVFVLKYFPIFSAAPLHYI